MIDPDRLDDDERAVWESMFPGGFWAGAPHREGDHFRLWSYAYWCELELGRVPQPVDEILSPDDYRAIGRYWRDVREQHRRASDRGK